MSKQLQLKTPKEIATLREGGKILAETLTLLAQYLKSQAEKREFFASELNDLALRELKKRKAAAAFLGYQSDKRQRPFPAALCVSINHEVVHGVPLPNKQIKTGDIVKLDMGVLFKRLITDATITVLVGNVSEKARKLANVTKESLDLGIAQISPGKKLGDFGHAVQTHAEKNGFSVVRDLVGHGVGYRVHEPPQILNYGKPNTGLKIQTGMVLALEPMLNAGNWRITQPDEGDDPFVFVTADGQLSAQFEHTVAVTESGCEVLTRL